MHATAYFWVSLISIRVATTPSLNSRSSVPISGPIFPGVKIITTQKYDCNLCFMLSWHLTVLGHKDPSSSIVSQAFICTYLLIAYGDGPHSEVPICMVDREPITP